MAPKFYHYDMNQWKRHWDDVRYCDRDERQKMDIIIPDEGDGPFPLIVFVHGGGWVSGDKRENTMPGAFKRYRKAMHSPRWNIALPQLSPGPCRSTM